MRSRVSAVVKNLSIDAFETYGIPIRRMARLPEISIVRVEIVKKSLQVASYSLLKKTDNTSVETTRGP